MIEGPAWFIQLDNTALLLDLGVKQFDESHGYTHAWSPDRFDFNREAVTITFDWKLVLHNMLVMQAAMTRRIHAHKNNHRDFINDDS